MINADEKLLLNEYAADLGVNPNDLYKLISFESGFNPQAKNPYSSARGLIQFTDKTAQSLGYNDSLDLVTQNPTIWEQLPIVYEYLSTYKPFQDKQSLYLSVFYPAARNWPPDKMFPDTVRAVNPGINTPNDYVNKVERVVIKTVSTLLIAAIAIGYLLFKFK